MKNSKINQRISIIALLLALFALLIALYFAKIMLEPQEELVRPISQLDIERGPILDRNGRLLAIQTELPTLTVWTPHVENAEATAQSLAQILDLPYESILTSLNLKDRDIILKRGLPPSESELIDLLQSQGELAGVTLRRGIWRIYPEGNIASHILGFVGTENFGLEGIEYTLEDLLSPKEGRVTPNIDSERIYGNQVFLTIDVVIQHRTEAIADRLMKEYSPKSVMILIADANTGELLSYVSKPDFDPNTFTEFTVDERKNRPVQISYEPGSAFKVFSIASIMQIGGINNSSQFNTSGGYTNSRIATPITDLGDYGVISPEGIIRFSSNVGAAYASDSVTADELFTMLQLFGFGQTTSIEMNGEERGILAHPSQWSGRTKPTIAIGQEIAVTAIQMLQAATAIANEGILLKPQIIRQILSPSGAVIRDFNTIELRKVLSPEIANQMLRYMQSASLPGGTGRRANLGNDIPISVKTGTGEVYDPQIRGYSKELFLASTLAIFPSNNPEIIIYVVIQHPSGDNFLGGVIAAPVVKEIAEFLISYLQIDRRPVISLPSSIEITEPETPEVNEFIPNFIGLPLSAVIGLYDRKDMSVQISGSGWVVGQDPEPGTPFTEGIHINLYLENEKSAN